MDWKKRITKISFKLHGWVGLAAGIFFLLYGLSGSLLVFRHELERYFNPELHRLVPGQKKNPADELYRMVLRSHPNLKKLVLHDFPRDRFDSYEFMLYKRQQKLADNYLYYVFVDPYSGKILREGGYDQFSPSFLRWIYTLHYSLQLGVPGMLLTAIVGLVMLLSLITGTVIYRKHFWKALRFKAGLNFRSWRTGVSSLHRIIGVWALLFNIILFFTGFWMLKEYFSPAMWTLPKQQANYEVAANIDSLMARACKTIPGFIPVAVTIPTVKDADILLRGQMPQTTNVLLQGKASGITFDAQTGEMKDKKVIDEQGLSERLEYMAYALHTGVFGGDILKWVYVIFGLTPGFLSISGALLWLKRKRR
ncbi:PepSY-associated TM helix domain-containing protein [Pedobacter sp. KACC 23697]|uniref:PepSY-associated TM helix domain-containing protein n=1 Tax=Pedobacter sp. KACC 23697 TaxID=3149230 RepID=A0AAU7K6P0_9SPHI